MCQFWTCRDDESKDKDQPFVFDRATSKVGADKSGLGDHSLPALLCRLLSRLDNLEHFLLGDTPDLGQGHTELGGLFGSLVLDGRRQSFGIFLVAAVEQVGGQRGVGGLGGLAALDVALLVGLDLLLHLDLLLAALLLVEFGAQAAVVLGAFRGIVAFTGDSLALALVVVEALAVLLCKALNVLVLRHGGVWVVFDVEEGRNRKKDWAVAGREAGSGGKL